MESVFNFGQWIIGLFSALFLIYMTKAIVKSRYKELGLLYGLGMDKEALRGILFIQNIILATFSILLGTFLSLLLSPLFINLIGKILGYGEIKLSFGIDSIKLGLITFLLIFILITIISLNSIRKKNPLELSQMSKKGESEPKFSIITFITSLMFLGLGYWIALKIDGALEAIPKFFPAVIFVILGTFLFFKSVMIWILKIIRKNKSIYYKSTNMTFIGELIKRSKESAMALSSITIISSMLLMSFIVMVAMFVGKNNLLDRVAPRDFSIYYRKEDLRDDVDRKLSENINFMGIKKENEGYADLSILTTKSEGDGRLSLVNDDEFKDIMMDKSIIILSLTDIDSYNIGNNSKKSLKDGEVFLYDSKKEKFDKISIENIDLKVSENIRESNNILTDPTATLFHNIQLVVKNKDDFINKLQEKRPDYEFSARQSYIKYFDLKDTRFEKKEEFFKNLSKSIESDENLKDKVEIKNSYEVREEFDQMHKGAYITIILLSFIFLISAIVVIYYKQASEGLDDGRNISILKKIGMSNKEIKKSVAKQNYVTFFAPLLLSIIHILIASKLILGMLQLFASLDRFLFIKVEAICILIFAFIYFLIFRLTLPIYFEMGKLNKE